MLAELITPGDRGDLPVHQTRDFGCTCTVRCPVCGGVKQERLPWLAENPHNTRRFARWVGKLCRGMSLTKVAADLRLDWHAVKAMDMAYM